jgi:hypothetical protein
MSFRPGRLLISAAILPLAASSALAAPSDLCVVHGENDVEVDLDIKRSLVVHDDATLDVSFTDVGETPPDGNDGAASLFSFARTIGAILESAEVANTAPEREALVLSMLRSFRLDQARNPQTSLPAAIEERLNEAAFSPEDLLDPNSENGLVPLGLFNRLDLAPDDWSYCGEHRIVYGKRNPGFENRFLLIFEAIVPNPEGEGESGCRPVGEFWAELSSEDDDMARAEKLAEFYYRGLGQPAAGAFSPAVHFGNFGGGARGQVRGNVFMQQPWLLREWRMQLSPTSGVPEFVVETVKDNPLAEFYADEFQAPGGLMTEQEQELASGELTRFQGEFLIKYRENLSPEASLQFQAFKEEMEKYRNDDLSHEQILLNSIALGGDNRYNEFQSVSQNGTSVPTDEPVLQAGAKFTTLLDALMGGLEPDPALRLSAEEILHRAGGASCGGCHNTTPGDVIGREPEDGGQQIVWPGVVPPGFVHASEDRVLSPALENHFLPFRAQALRHHLCADLPEPEVVAAAGVAAEAAPAQQKSAAPEVEVPQAGGGVETMSLEQALQSEPSFERRLEITTRADEETRALRAEDREKEGAFYRIRRPH